MSHFQMRVLAVGGILGSLLAVSACGTEGTPDPEAPWAPPIPFEAGVVQVTTSTDTLTLAVDVADTPERRALGLMDRPSLGADQGMIFLYPEVQDSAAGFWMFRTLLPLDIAFVDSAGSVVAVRTMDPCESPNPEFCPTYSPGARYQSALEVNRGFLAEHGIQVGDQVSIRPDG